MFQVFWWHLAQFIAQLHWRDSKFPQNVLECSHFYTFFIFQSKVIQFYFLPIFLIQFTAQCHNASKMVLTSISRFERPGQKSPHREFNLPWISRFVEVVAVADPNVCSKLPTVRNDPHFSRKCAFFRFKTCRQVWKLSLIPPPQQILKPNMYIFSHSAFFPFLPHPRIGGLWVLVWVTWTIFGMFVFLKKQKY